MEEEEEQRRLDNENQNELSYGLDMSCPSKAPCQGSNIQR